MVLGTAAKLTSMYKQPALHIQALSTFPANSNPSVTLYLRMCTVITQDAVKRRGPGQEAHRMPWKPM